MRSFNRTTYVNKKVTGMDCQSKRVRHEDYHGYVFSHVLIEVPMVKNITDILNYFGVNTFTQNQEEYTWEDY